MIIVLANPVKIAMMSSCLENIIPLGCFSSCDEINTNVNATVSGIWKARVLFNGMALDKEFEAEIGQEIKVPNVWPEDLVLFMQLIKPDGMPMSDNLYSFKNKMVSQI